MGLNAPPPKKKKKKKKKPGKVWGQNSVLTKVVLIGSFACRARIDWYLAKFIVRYY